MKQQGTWFNWEGAKTRKVSLGKLWKRDTCPIKFLLQAVYDLLPSPTNLTVWGKTEDPRCKL